MKSMQNRTQNRTSGFPALTFALALLVGCAAPLEGMEKEVKPTDLEALKATGAKANGLVVWTSSRDGLPHVYSMRTDGSDVKQLTKGENTDWRPRFSPDGSKILFQRSRAQDFVRERDANAEGAWDLYTMGADGSDLKKVIEDATWGSWAGPEEIVFLRGTKVMRAKLGGESEKETRIFDAARYAIFDGSVLQQPELSHDGHFVALTLAGKHRQVGIWSVKKKQWTDLGEGTQIAWTPDGASVYWIDDRGKEQSRVAREPIVAGTPADDRDPDKLLLVDLESKRSRERFPRLSNDGKWLVFAAAVNDLEDDVEDFELFLWEAGSPATSATRLTFHTSNDRWPDVFIGEAGKAPAQAEDKGGDQEGAKEGAEGEKNAEQGPGHEKVEKAAASEKVEPARETEGGARAAAPAETEREPAPSAGSQSQEREPDESAVAAPAKAKGKKKRR
jgi:hypothetical protein